MIEQLFDWERLHGEPEYNQFTEQIVQIQRSLRTQLGQNGKELLDQLTDAYMSQSEVLMKTAFVDGFCSAADLLLEVLQRRSS